MSIVFTDKAIEGFFAEVEAEDEWFEFLKQCTHNGCVIYFIEYETATGELKAQTIIQPPGSPGEHIEVPGTVTSFERVWLPEEDRDPEETW